MDYNKDPINLMTGGNEDNGILWNLSSWCYSPGLSSPEVPHLLKAPWEWRVELNSLMLCYFTVWPWSFLFSSLNSSFLIYKTRKSIPLDLRSSRIPNKFSGAAGRRGRGSPGARLSSLPSLRTGQPCSPCLGHCASESDSLGEKPFEAQHSLKSIDLEDHPGSF